MHGNDHIFLEKTNTKIWGKNLGRAISLGTLMILLITSSCQATIFVSLKEKINATATIAENNMELEFLMDSDIGKMLIDY